MVQITNPHSNKSYEFLFGADPELFVTKDGRPVSAHGLIKGDKKDPMKVKSGAVQVDGMALEFNIDPAKDFKTFDSNIKEVMQTLKGLVPDYEFMVQPVAEFGAPYIASQPKEARELGCEPDYNAYTGLVNPTPKVDTPFRTASGHLHIGWTKDVDPFDPTHFEACRALVKNLDVFVGIPAVIWDTEFAPEGAPKRRALYGKAGAFRPKPYGLEYRVLSNIWITDKVFRKTVFENAILAVKETFKDWTRAGEQKFAIDEEVPLKDERGKNLEYLSARDIVDNNPGWYSAVFYATEFGGVRPPAYYRAQEAAELRKVA